MSDTPETNAERKTLQMFYDKGKLDVGIESIFVDMTKLEQQRDEAFKLYNAAVIGTKLIDKDLNEAVEQRDRLKHELAEMLQQRDEWKANHDNQVAINRILRDRPDIGDRAKLVDELIQQRDQAEETAERYRLDANAMMMQRDRLEMIACELIAMIRMNVACGKFAECSFEQINEHLKPWIERTQSVKGTQIE